MQPAEATLSLGTIEVVDAMFVGERQSASEVRRGSSQGRFCLVDADERPSASLLALVLQREAEFEREAPERWKEKGRQKQTEEQDQERQQQQGEKVQGGIKDATVVKGGSADVSSNRDRFLSTAGVEIASSPGGRDERFASALSSASSGAGSGKGFFVGSFESSAGSSGSTSSLHLGSILTQRSRKESLGVGGEMHAGAGIGIGAGIGVGTGVGSGLAAGLAGISSMANAAMRFRTKNSEEVEERSSARGGDDSRRNAIRISSNADSSFVSELPAATLKDPENEANSVCGFSLGLSDSLSDERSSGDEYMSELSEGGGTRSMNHNIDEQGEERKDDYDYNDEDEERNDERDEEGHVAEGVYKRGHEAQRQTFSDGDGPLIDGGGERSAGSGYASDGVATPGRRASVRREQKREVHGPRRGNETQRFRGKHRSLGSSGRIVVSLYPPAPAPLPLMRHSITTEAAKPKVTHF